MPHTKKINRTILLSLGFDETIVPLDESDDDFPYMYWTLDIMNPDDPSQMTSLISNEVDISGDVDVDDITIDIMIFEVEVGKCETVGELYTLIRILSKFDKK